MIELLDLGKADVHLWRMLRLALLQQLRQPVQCLGTEHHVHKGRTPDDLGPLLTRHAAPHPDLHATGLEVPDAPQIAEDLFLRLFTHGAGVEEDEIGLLHVVGFLVALRCTEHIGHLVRVVLVHLAAECLDVNLAWSGIGHEGNSCRTPCACSHSMEG